jgi:aminopeptidase
MALVPPQRARARPFRRELPKLDFALASAARRVVEGSLGVVPAEHVVVCFDREHEELAVPMLHVISDIGADAHPFVLEDLSMRPHLHLETSIVRALEQAQASVLVCGFHSGEYTMRTELIDLAASHGLRHAHMIGLTRRSMIAGLATDPQRIADISRALLVRIGPSSVVQVKSPNGTDLVVRFNPHHRWANHTGIIRPGKKENLPGGEIVTCPGDVTGIYVADGSIGEAGGSLTGLLKAAPVRLELEASVLRKVESLDPALARRITALSRSATNMDRVALASMGTNVGMQEPVGEIFVDQTLPSFHLSLGLTFPERTGATWSSTGWLAFTQTASDIDVDGHAVMRAGRYLLG